MCSCQATRTRRSFWPFTLHVQLATVLNGFQDRPCTWWSATYFNANALPRPHCYMQIYMSSSLQWAYIGLCMKVTSRGVECGIDISADRFQVMGGSHYQNPEGFIYCPPMLTSNWPCMCCHGRQPYLKGVHNSCTRSMTQCIDEVTRYSADGASRSVIDLFSTTHPDFVVNTAVSDPISDHCCVTVHLHIPASSAYRFETAVHHVFCRT